jgi:hypothetical protein
MRKQMASFRRFYGHFAAAYGTCWIVLMTLAIVSMSHIDSGAFGFFGFPIISLIYAIVRTVQVRRPPARGLCVNCGYNLTGNTSGVCSECGTPIRAV